MRDDRHPPLSDAARADFGEHLHETRHERPLATDADCGLQFTAPGLDPKIMKKADVPPGHISNRAIEVNEAFQLWMYEQGTGA